MQELHCSIYIVEMSRKKSLIPRLKSLKDNILLKRLLAVLSLDILVKASAFILLPLYLRLMTQEEYGVFNYMLSISYSFATILNLGLFISQSKLYHDFTNFEEKKKLLFNINILLLGGLTIIILPVYIFRLDYAAIRFLFKNVIDYERYRLWILLITITSLFSYMLTNFLYTAEKIRTINTYNLLRAICINSISILALYLAKDYDAITIRFAVTSCIELILLLIFYGSYINHMTPVISFRLISKSLKLGLPIMLAALFSIIINFGDKFFLEKKVDYQKLSVYYLAFSCASIISIISNSLQNVWLPLFFKEKNLLTNIKKTNKMVMRLVLVLIALSIAIMLVIFGCLSFSIIPKSYFEVIYVLPLLLAGQIIICLALLYSNYLTYFEKTSVVLWAGLFVSAGSIGLNLLLIPIWEIYGAAVTILFSNTCYLAIYYLIIRFYKNKQLGSYSKSSG